MQIAGNNNAVNNDTADGIAPKWTNDKQET